MPEPARLHGVIVPLLTPTDREDRVDEQALRHSIDRLIDAGVHGLFVGGTAGEGPLLTEPEWDRLVEIAFDQTQGRIALLGGAQDTSTRRVVGRIHRLRKIGYRSVVLTPTYYIGATTGAEHLRHFGACHEAADGIELIPYNIPQVTGSWIAVETFQAAARSGWVRYCKESSGDLEYLRRLISAGEEIGLKVLAGDEQTAAKGLMMGAVGIVPVCANIEPQTYIRLWETALQRDEEALRRLQERVDTLVEGLARSGPCWLAGPKYALARLGIGEGTPVSPLQPTGQDQARKIDDLLMRAGREGGLRRPQLPHASAIFPDARDPGLR